MSLNVLKTCVISVASQRSISNCVEMYYVTMLCLRQMYISIVSNPTSTLATSNEVYSH